ncbi:MAG: GspMb/PilO family protein [Candidatus Eisenbacteria bacterium]
MNPVLDARLRRQLPLLIAVITTAVFMAAHNALFQPVVRRYETALKTAGESGAVFDGSQVQAMLPPRVHALLMDHSLSEAEADQKSRAGLLGAELVQRLSDVAGRNGLYVIVAEPDAGGESPSTIQPRAHVKLRGPYASLLAVLDELARNGSLITIERFTIAPVAEGNQDIDLYASGFILRRTPRKP